MTGDRCRVIIMQLTFCCMQRELGADKEEGSLIPRVARESEKAECCHFSVRGVVNTGVHSLISAPMAGIFL